MGKTQILELVSGFINEFVLMVTHFQLEKVLEVLGTRRWR